MNKTIVQRTICVYRLGLLRVFGYWYYLANHRVFFLLFRVSVHFARLLKHPH